MISMPLEPNTLEGKHGEVQILVMEEGEEPVQLDHCAGEVDILGTLRPEFLNEIIVPLLGNRAVGYTSFVNSPQREIGVLLREMAEQFLNLFARGSWCLPLVD